MNLVWLRNDLRLDDNPALYQACQRGGTVGVVYIATPGQWQQHDEAPLKLGFRSAALTSVRKQLAQLGIVFELLETPYYKDVAKLLLHYCRQHKVQSLWFNQEIPLNEQLRDAAVVQALSATGVNCNSFNAELLVPAPIINKQDKPYRVFTPWYRAWLKQLAENQSSPLSQPSCMSKSCISKPVPPLTTVISLPGSSEFRDDLWPATEANALQRLASFTHRQLSHYSEQRDFPAIKGTSTLSPYLASGLVSPRRCLMAIQQIAHQQGWDWRDSVWLRELGWREFYRYLMINFPHLSKGQPFKAQPNTWPWQANSALLKAWQTGNTGFPFIDAAMRQLLRTGWMHNRLRMVTASFFCKLMLLDWREGEKFFMSHLIDGDFASNNGGWQWSSSTGCDASPWFRIFNPTAQSEKFDRNGDFIRKMLPELAQLPDKQIHNPPNAVRQALGYPAQIVDYKAARERALTVLKT